jgi:hypothetical protein
MIDKVQKSLPTSIATNKKVVRVIKHSKKECITTFLREMREFSRKNSSYPIVRAVAVLPKEELAVMAETLVNLTSFKRRVTLDAETVGGPIDVAVISKGDGFIWIKRKHYFESELNPQFFKTH